MKADFVIIGGGTAGWMSAALLQHYFADQGKTIVLVQSPTIGTIGVGEGSTPHLRNFFNTLGWQESDWMPKCQATFKLGINFHGWGHERAASSYFHPFPSAADQHSAKLFLTACELARQGKSVNSTSDNYFLTAQLSKLALSPKMRPNTMPLPLNYAYHFDAAKLATLLQEHTTQNGVTLYENTVTKVTRTPSGALDFIELDNNQQIHGTWYIDCSGFSGLLAKQHLNGQFKSYQNELFNDRAVVIPTPASETLTPATESIAMSSGWRWQIPLQQRTGNGYVYSSRYQSPDQAELELRRSLNLLDDQPEAQHLTMHVGRLEHCWQQNCVAVGLSQGFIEPLEATALHLVQETIERFIQALQQGAMSDQYQAWFNNEIATRFDGIKDYITCHYKVNGRTDSQYWIDNRENSQISSTLSELISIWRQGGNLIQAIQQRNIAQYYSPISWYCLLDGYGVVPEPCSNEPVFTNESITLHKQLTALTRQFESHKTVLQGFVGASERDQH